MDIEQLKNMLLQNSKDLQERLEKTSDHIRHKDTEIDKDFAEQVVQRENDEVVESLYGQLQKELAQIKQALQRIEDGNYGICKTCGNEISMERLQIIPQTTLCKTCIHESENYPGNP